MQFSPSQLTNPGNLVYDDKRRKAHERFEAAVSRAGFLNNKEKHNWNILSHLLSSEELQAGERLVISEDLRRLSFKHQLESIKPNENYND